MGCAGRQELGEMPRGATARGLVVAVALKEGIVSLKSDGVPAEGENSPFWNELVQKSSSPLPKGLQEGRGRKGGAQTTIVLTFPCS